MKSANYVYVEGLIFSKFEIGLYALCMLIIMIMQTKANPYSMLVIVAINTALLIKTVFYIWCMESCNYAPRGSSSSGSTTR